MKKQIKKTKKNYTFPVVIEQDEDGFYIASVPALRGCYTQAKTLPVLYKRLEEVVELCLEVEKELSEKIPVYNKFVGIQNLSFSV